jgi:hypothetical protein
MAVMRTCNVAATLTPLHGGLEFCMVIGVQLLGILSGKWKIATWRLRELFCCEYIK